MRFILVSPKTVDDVAKYFGVNDPGHVFWFFEMRLSVEEFYFLEEYTTKKRLKLMYFDKLEKSHREALSRAMWDQYNLLFNDGTMTEQKYRESLGLA